MHRSEPQRTEEAAAWNGHGADAADAADEADEADVCLLKCLKPEGKGNGGDRSQSFTRPAPLEWDTKTSTSRFDASAPQILMRRKMRNLKVLFMHIFIQIQPQSHQSYDPFFRWIFRGFLTNFESFLSHFCVILRR